METEKIEIIREGQNIFRVRRTIKTTYRGLLYNYERKNISHLSRNGHIWFAEDEGFMNYSFSTMEEAEEAYRRYCKFIEPPPPAEVVKVLKDE